MQNDKVVINRVINAPIEDVFSAWTDASKMKQWYSPEGMTTPDASSDQRKDGIFSVTMQMGEQRFDIVGTYLEYDEPNKLVFTWKWKGSPEEVKPTLVTIEFKKIDDTKTDVTLTHSGFTDESDRAQHEQGWTGTFNKLDSFVK